MKTSTKIRQITVKPIPVSSTSLPDFIKWENIEIKDYVGENVLPWFIELLKQEEKVEPNFSKLIHCQEIVKGPPDIFDYISEKNEVCAQPLLVFCLLMKERQKSQQINEYFCIFKEEENKLFAKIQINEKIEIKFFPYGKNFLQKNTEKRNLLLRVLK